MPIKLQVIKRGADAEDPADYLFEQDRVTMGRGTENDLTLPDQKVSKQHAELRYQNGVYQLVDLGSKNHTYLHGERLTAHQPCALQSGDVFHIGDFRVEFITLFMPSSEQTVVVSDEGANPFDSYATRLANALQGVTETYNMMNERDRDEQLREAFRGAFDERAAQHPALKQVLHSLGLDLGASTGNGQAGHAPDGAAPALPESADEVLDVVLDALAQLVDIPRRFWHEFTGHTAVNTEEREFLRRASGESLRAHLLERDLSKEKRARRLTYVKDAADVLVQHEVAMLHGYMASATKGTRSFMQRLRPDRPTGADGEQGGVFGKLFGSREKSDAATQMEKRWQALYHGNWAAIEKEDFRPAFVDAYMQRMAPAMSGDPSPSEDDRAQKRPSFEVDPRDVSAS
jgi:hypothetical protein